MVEKILVFILIFGPVCGYFYFLSRSIKHRKKNEGYVLRLYILGLMLSLLFTYFLGSSSGGFGMIGLLFWKVLEIVGILILHYIISLTILKKRYSGDIDIPSGFVENIKNAVYKPKIFQVGFFDGIFTVIIISSIVIVVHSFLFLPNFIVTVLLFCGLIILPIFLIRKRQLMLYGESSFLSSLVIAIFGLLSLLYLGRVFYFLYIDFGGGYFSTYIFPLFGERSSDSETINIFIYGLVGWLIYIFYVALGKDPYSFPKGDFDKLGLNPNITRGEIYNKIQGTKKSLLLTDELTIGYLIGSILLGGIGYIMGDFLFSLQYVNIPNIITGLFLFGIFIIIPGYFIFQLLIRASIYIYSIRLQYLNYIWKGPETSENTIRSIYKTIKKIHSHVGKVDIYTKNSTTGRLGHLTILYLWAIIGEVVAELRVRYDNSKKKYESFVNEQKLQPVSSQSKEISRLESQFKGLENTIQLYEELKQGLIKI